MTQITFSNSTATANTADAATFSTGNFTSNANSLFLVQVHNQAAGGATLPTLTGGGQSQWDQIATITVSGAAPPGRLTVFRALSASPGAAAPLVVDYGGSTQSGTILIANEVTNVDTSGANGAGAVVQSNTAQSGSTTIISVAQAAFADATNNANFAATGCMGVAGAITAGGGFTSMGVSPTHATPSARGASEYRIGQQSSSNASATFGTTGAGAIIALEIKFSASGSGVAQTSTSIRNALYRRRRRS